MSHADLLREATAVMATPAFFFFFFLSSGGWGKIKLELTTLPRIFIRVVCRVSALYDTAVWYLVRVCGRVAVWVCNGGGMNDAIGSKNTCKTFSIEFFD